MTQHYPYKVNHHEPTPILIPIRFILVDYKISRLLDELRTASGTASWKEAGARTARRTKPLSKGHGQTPDHVFDKSQINELRLRPPMGRLFKKFINRDTIEPIYVKRGLAIKDPSPLNPDLPNEETVTKDFLYQPISGNEQIALSIYFGYDYIPSIVVI